MSWPNVKLETIAANEPYSFIGGPFGSNLTTKDYVESGIPVIRGVNLNGGRYLDHSKFVYVSYEKMRKDLSSNLARPGDVVFTQRGTLGQISIIDDNSLYSEYVISQSQMKLTVNQHLANRHFIFYYFSTDEAIEKLKSYTSSSGVPHINLTVLRNFKIPLPPIHVQDSIVQLLSTYDDLIENNRRRIQLLEQAARLLYKEWFVHFRFPGHEHVTITDGVPEAWQPTSISKLATVYRGKSYKSSELRDEGGHDFVNLKCIQRFGGFRSSGIKRFEGEHKEHHRVFSGDIVMAVTDMTRDAMIVAQAGRIPRAIGERAIYSMDLVKIVPEPEIAPNWLYLLFRHSEFSFVVREHATGTNVLHLKPKYIENWRAPLPPTTLRRTFAEVVDPILAQVDLLESQNSALAKARDLLLPRLMTGEIQV